MSIFDFSKKQPVVGIVIVNGSCCFQGLAQIEAQLNQMIEQVIKETGVPTRIKTITAIQAALGGVPRKMFEEGMAQLHEDNRPPLPAVLINGKPVGRGTPDAETFRTALLQAYAAIQSKEK